MISCQEENQIVGNWKIDLKIQEHDLPFIIKLKKDETNKDKILGHLINSTEKIPLDGSFIDGKFELDIGTSYAKLIGTIDGNELDGNWVRTNKENYKVQISGQKILKENLYQHFESKKTPLSFGGNWKIDLGKDKFGLGIFTQKGSRIQGSILTETGDYRFLDGYIEQNNILLYGFDGVFSFVLKIILSPDQFKANLYSGKTYNQDISGVRDEEFRLADPNGLTKLIGKKPLKLSFNDINGEEIDFNKGRFKDKAKIIQIFGSWCPNCIDETQFLVEWRTKNEAKLNDIEFIAIAFEKFPDEVAALKKLRKMRYKLGMNYPLVLGDFTSTKTVTKFVPIEKTIAFPTTFYLNKKNEIIKVHTGFSGQATGMFYEDFKTDFNKTVNALIKEDF
jgi:thiol-disulfide isomerase/thioredoxin